jgi:UDP-N-acetylmuramoyl-tripeptide--D-alanyl-D-alanine ligase
MKHLHLNQLLPVLEGKVIHGKGSQVIKNSAKYGEHVITDHSLVFILKKGKTLPLPTKVTSITVVTSTPRLLKNVSSDTTIVYVPNVKKAYYQFISFYRNLFTLPVIGVTGTSGKTTTKEMITKILAEDQKVVSTYLSHNGLRRNLDYLLEIDDTTDSAVFEMGVSGPNQLLYSARYFRPKIGIITTIGTDHIEGFKHQDSYVKEKSKMVQAVGPKGTIILNHDNPYCRRIDLKSFSGKVIYYGMEKTADYYAHSVTFNLEKNGMDFVIVCKEGEYSAFVPGFGKHNVYNAMAAIIACSLVGVSIPEAIERLQTFTHVKSHLQFYKGLNGSQVIDDTWNTNLTSIEAALEVLKETAGGRKTVAIIGEIEELGEYSVSEHQKVGALVVKNKIDRFIAVGRNTIPACQKAFELGMSKANIHHVTSHSALMELLKGIVDENTSVLLKTSMRRSFKNTVNQLILKGKESD